MDDDQAVTTSIISSSYLYFVLKTNRHSIDYRVFFSIPITFYFSLRKILFSSSDPSCVRYCIESILLCFTLLDEYF